MSESEKWKKQREHLVKQIEDALKEEIPAVTVVQRDSYEVYRNIAIGVTGILPVLVGIFSSLVPGTTLANLIDLYHQ